jgi:hypothetical protein
MLFERTIPNTRPMSCFIFFLTIAYALQACVGNDKGTGNADQVK